MVAGVVCWLRWVRTGRINFGQDGHVGTGKISIMNILPKRQKCKKIKGVQPVHPVQPVQNKIKG
jgi:hypothetical protein